MNLNKPTRVAVLGGVRIPFCRAFSGYQELTNKDMLAHTLQGLSTRFGLAGERIDEVAGGAVTTHSRDWNLTREAILSTDLSPETPGITMQQACGTSLQAAMLLAGKIATGQIDSAIACGADTISDTPLVFGDRFTKRMIRMSRAKSPMASLGAFKGMSLGELKPVAPSPTEPRTKLSMGQHCELMAREWRIPREQQDFLAVDSHRHLADSYDSGFQDGLVLPCEGVIRDNNLRPDSKIEDMAALRTVFDKGPTGTLTAANSTALTDGASAVLLASEDWARTHEIPVQAYLTYARSASVDFVKGEGLLMAPTVAVSELLSRAGLELQEFDYYEIHEAFAAQVLCTLEAWKSDDYCRTRLGRPHALGEIDRSKLNVNGSSLAAGHPFAATGARIMGVLSKLLAEKGSGRGLISICTAGGMGVAAILEAA